MALSLLLQQRYFQSPYCRSPCRGAPETGHSITQHGRCGAFLLCPSFRLRMIRKRRRVTRWRMAQESCCSLQSSTEMIRERDARRGRYITQRYGGSSAANFMVDRKKATAVRRRRCIHCMQCRGATPFVPYASHASSATVYGRPTDDQLIRNSSRVHDGSSNRPTVGANIVGLDGRGKDHRRARCGHGEGFGMTTSRSAGTRHRMRR